MRRSISLAGMVVVLLTVAAAVSAGGSFEPDSHTVAFGTSIGGNTDSLKTDDADYLDVDSKKDDNVRKVIVKAFYVGVPTADDTLSVSWLGQTGLKQGCDLTLSAFLWKRQKFVVAAQSEVGEGPADASIGGAIPGDDDSRYVKDGKARVKATCKNDSSFLLKTERILFSS